jgi:hypothetical protein
MPKAKNKILTVKIPIGLYERICDEIIDSNIEQLKGQISPLSVDSIKLSIETENRVCKYFTEDRLQKVIEETIPEVLNLNPIYDYMETANITFSSLYEKLINEGKKKEASKLDGDARLIWVSEKDLDKARKILQAAGLPYDSK